MASASASYTGPPGFAFFGALYAAANESTPGAPTPPDNIQGWARGTATLNGISLGVNHRTPFSAFVINNGVASVRVGEDGRSAFGFVDLGTAAPTIQLNAGVWGAVNGSVGNGANDTLSGIANAAAAAWVFAVPLPPAPASSEIAMSLGDPVFGDLNFDGQLDAADIDAFGAYISSEVTGSVFASGYDPASADPDDVVLGANPMFDLNLDQSVDAAFVLDFLDYTPDDDSDHAYLVRDLVGTQFGDVDLDGEVTEDDYNIANTNFGEVAGWSDGDMNGDNVISRVDLAIVQDNIGWGVSSASAAPEPSALVMALVACCPLVRRRKS